METGGTAAFGLLVLVLLVTLCTCNVVFYEQMGLLAIGTEDKLWTTEGMTLPTSIDWQCYAWFDWTNSSLAATGTEEISYAPISQPFFNASVRLFANANRWEVFNDQCREGPPAWSFDADCLNQATLVGETECSFSVREAPETNYPLLTAAMSNNGSETCLRYTLANGVMHLDVFVMDDSNDTQIVLPITLRELKEWSDPSSEWMYNATYRLTEFWLSALPEGTFDAPDLCYEPPYYCDGGEIVTMDMYRFHKQDDWVLAQRNTGDLEGDTGYVCEQSPSSADNMLSLFTVQVNTTWGQYALCNNDICQGGTNDTVGHSGAMHFGSPHGGQCDTNVGIGNWFSLTAEAECDSDQEVGDGCSWKFLEWKKTVTHDCLLDLGFLQACRADERLPFPSASALVQQAFDSDDANAGGCPNVYPAMYNVSDPYSSYANADDDDAKGDSPFNYLPVDIIVVVLLGLLLVGGVLVAVAFVGWNKKRDSKYDVLDDDS